MKTDIDGTFYTVQHQYGETSVHLSYREAKSECDSKGGWDLTAHLPDGTSIRL